jgi:hypothetical protein
LGQVLHVKAADRMYALDGREVRSFSHLRHEFYDETIFVISSGPAKVNRELARLPRTHSEPGLRRSRMGAGSAAGLAAARSMAAEMSPSASSSRDTDSPATGGGSIKILIDGVRKIYYPPVPPPPEDNSPPPRRPVLEWVFGYRGADRVCNLWVLEKGELVYFTGTVVVIYHRMEETQRHYTAHTEDITCLDIHPQGAGVQNLRQK